MTVGTDRTPSSAAAAWKLPVLMGLSAAIVVVAILSVVHTVRSFFVLDYAATWVETGLRVDRAPPGSSADLAGLLAGDLVVEANGRPLSALSDPAFLLASGGELSLGVRRQDGSSAVVAYVSPPPVIDAVFLSRSLVALVGLACALIAVVTTRRREAVTFLLMALASLVVATVPHRTAASGVLFAVLHRASGAAISFLLLRFFAIFPGRPRRMVWWDLATVGAMAVAAATAVTGAGRGLWPAVAIGLRAAFVAALIAGAALQIQRWRSAVRVAGVRRQIEWAALGMFVGLLPYGVLVLLPRWLGFGFEPFSWVMVLPVAAVPVGFLAALREYRLWDLEPITRDSLSAALVLCLGGLVFAAVNSVLVRRPEPPAPLRNLLVFATGVGLVVLLLPVRRRVGVFLDRWLYHGRPAPRGLVTGLTRELAETVEPGELLRRLVDALGEGLELEPTATYLRSRDGRFLRVTGDGTLPETLPSSVLESVFPAAEERPLARTGHTGRVPLERAGTVHGLLFIGLRRGIFPPGREGKELIAALAAQTALGLQSARLLDDLRRQAEEYRILHANTRRIIESSAAGILVCDARGRVLSANVRAASIFDRDAEELVGRRLGEFMDVPKGWQPELPVHVVNAEVRSSGEAPRWLVMTISILELESGLFNGRVVVLQDVTDLRELEGRLREQERLASLGRLASGLAHEINTPLTGIASFAQMLGDMTREGDPRSELIGKLVDQSFRVSRIVANLHQAMRGAQSERSVVDLATLVERAAYDAERSMGLEGAVKLTLPGHDLPVEAAPGVIELAVSNLVRNGVEASPAGELVTVTVTMAGGSAEVWVDDRGSGVPEALREKVFEPFFTTRTQRGGTGLGLAITRDMIAQQGGEVRLEDSPLGGTRAVMRLPLHRVPATS